MLNWSLKTSWSTTLTSSGTFLMMWGFFCYWGFELLNTLIQDSSISQETAAVYSLRVKRCVWKSLSFCRWWHIYCISCAAHRSFSGWSNQEGNLKANIWMCNLLQQKSWHSVPLWVQAVSLKQLLMFGAEGNSHEAALSFFHLFLLHHSGDVWHYSGWEPVGRCLWTPRRVLGSVLASYAHITQHAAQPTVGTQSGLHGALTLSCCHSGEITIKLPQ